MAVSPIVPRAAFPAAAAARPIAACSIDARPTAIACQGAINRAPTRSGASVRLLWFLILGSPLVLGSWFLILGSWFLVLGSWFLVLGSRAEVAR